MVRDRDTLKMVACAFFSCSQVGCRGITQEFAFRFDARILIFLDSFLVLLDDGYLQGIF